MFSTSDRHCKIHQLRWQNMSAHLTNETSYWLKKFLMHLNWAICNVCDLNIDAHVCFFPDLVTGSGPANPVSAARGLSATQREASMRSLTIQKPKRLPRVNMCVLSLSISPLMIVTMHVLHPPVMFKREIWIIRHWLGLIHETLVRAVCLLRFMITVIPSDPIYVKSKTMHCERVCWEIYTNNMFMLCSRLPDMETPVIINNIG